MSLLSSTFKLVKKALVGDLEKRVTELERDMKQVWSELGKVQGFQNSLEFRTEKLYQDFGRYRHRTEAELSEMKRVLEYLLIDVEQILAKMECFEVQNEQAQQQLMDSRAKVVSIRKRAKNNLTRINNELGAKSA